MTPPSNKGTQVWQPSETKCMTCMTYIATAVSIVDFEALERRQHVLGVPAFGPYQWVDLSKNGGFLNTWFLLATHMVPVEIWGPQLSFNPIHRGYDPTYQLIHNLNWRCGVRLAGLDSLDPESRIPCNLRFHRGPVGFQSPSHPWSMVESSHCLKNVADPGSDQERKTKYKKKGLEIDSSGKP